MKTALIFLETNRLAVSLLCLRAILAIYLSQWAWLHIQYTSEAMNVYMRWFKASPNLVLLSISGYILMMTSFMMILGFGLRFICTLAILFFGTLFIGLIPHLLDPYGFHQTNWPNHALIAQVPVLASYIAMYIFQSFDMYSLDRVLSDKSGNQNYHLADIGDAKAAYAMLLIRVTCAFAFCLWGMEKFIAADMSEGILQRWYGIDSNKEIISKLLGCFEILLALALLTGTLQRLTYAISALIKLKTCWAIAAFLLFPFATESGGLLSSVGPSMPLLAVLCFLYAVRAWDVFSFDKKYRQVRASNN